MGAIYRSSAIGYMLRILTLLPKIFCVNALFLLLVACQPINRVKQLTGDNLYIKTRDASFIVFSVNTENIPPNGVGNLSFAHLREGSSDLFGPACLISDRIRVDLRYSKDPKYYIFQAPPGFYGRYQETSADSEAPFEFFAPRGSPVYLGQFVATVVANEDLSEMEKPYFKDQPGPLKNVPIKFHRYFNLHQAQIDMKSRLSENLVGPQILNEGHIPKQVVCSP